jgi:hypothetical protein
MNNPDIKGLIAIVKTGDREEVKKAQKAIESAWHNYYIPHRKEGRKAFEAFVGEVKTFDQIPDIDHQVYFIGSLKWAIWTFYEEYFETWMDFILKNIQHPSGKIRQAIIHISDILILNIAVDIKGVHKQTSKEAKMIKEVLNRQRFGRFVFAIEELVQHYHKPEYNRYKYVSSLPPSVYKSLQILMTEKLLRSEYYEHLYADFLHDVQKSKLKNNQSN